MLLRFGVANFGAIRDYQELSFVASSYKDPGVDLFEPKGFKGKVLPTIGLYGANASGKSTLLRALRFFVSGIRYSYEKPTRSAKIGRTPFALDPKYARKPTRVDCDLLIEGTRFHYGFSVNTESVEQEWLYAFYPVGNRITRRTWFYRDQKAKKPIVFGKELRGLRKTLEELTREDALFLSVAAGNNHKQLLQIHEYFSKRFHFRDADFHVDETAITKYLQDPDIHKRVLEFLRLADTGITGTEIRARKTPKEAEPLMLELKELVKKHTGQGLEITINEEPFELRIGHRSTATTGVAFRLNQESSGTVALLGILGPVFDSLKSGALLVVDELNTNLHPLVSKELVALFSSKASNPNGGQLVFATHDTNLLCGSSLRRDQIWFTEKDREGSTHVYPLSDIKTRPTDNLERGYLDGRFGAIPFFRSLFLPLEEQTKEVKKATRQTKQNG